MLRASARNVGVVLLVLSAQASPSSAGPWRVAVRWGEGNVPETPVVVEVKAAVPPGAYRLRPEGGGAAGVAQVWADGGATFLGAVLKGKPGQTSERFTLEPDKSSGTGVAFRPSGPNLDVLVNGALWTTYRTDEPTKPYFFPVNGPTGASFTRAYPMKTDVAGEDHDHPHQRSLWFTHGDVNGVDFWASDPLNKPSPKYGTIRPTSREVVTSGPAVGILRTTDDWLGPDGTLVCRDERTVRFYNTDAGRVFDFDVRIKADTRRVTFGDTKEGMFGLRVASSMDVKNKKGGKITNAEGVTDLAAWGKASPWVDYTGPVAGKTVGVAVLNHSSSFRSPTTWHVRDYGLFAANPFGWHDFGRYQRGDHVVGRGDSILFRFRVVLHEGDTASARPADAFRVYAEPPTVEVEGG